MAKLEIAIRALTQIAEQTVCYEEQGLGMAEHFHNIAKEALADMDKVDKLEELLSMDNNELSRLILSYKGEKSLLEIAEILSKEKNNGSSE